MPRRTDLWEAWTFKSDRQEARYFELTFQNKVIFGDLNLTNSSLENYNFLAISVRIITIRYFFKIRGTLHSGTLMKLLTDAVCCADAVHSVEHHHLRGL